MRRFFVVGILMSLMLISCATEQARKNLFEPNKPLGISAFVDGWDSMVSFIESHKGEIARLKGQTFRLRIKLEGQWQLIIFPQGAFELERTITENVFKVEIVRPGILFENHGGLRKMAYIQAEIRKFGGEKGTVDLTADVECLFKMNFRQKDGTPVNFDRLLEAYEYDLVITPAQYLDIYSVNPEFVILRRKKFMDEEVSLRLLLVDKKNKETFYSSRVQIPHCGFTPKVELPQKEKYHLIKDPSQCLVHVETIGNRYDTTQVHKIYAGEVFSNICKHGLKCKLTAKYGYIKDKKVVDADTQVYDFKVAARSVVQVDTSWEYVNQQFEFDSKLYMASTVSRDSVPEKFNAKNQPDFFECLWDEN